MIESKPQIERVFIEKSSSLYPLSEKVLNNLGDIPQQEVDDEEEVREYLRLVKDPIGKGKKMLLLKSFKGDFIKPCPCTPHYLGCNYFIINADLNCPMDCSYCILQHYLDNPVLTVHVNTQDLWAELDRFLKTNKDRFLRIGTGELGDSLALDHLTERSRELISYFRDRPRANLELKTKTTHIQNVMSEKPAENIVIAWSLNSEKMAAAEETLAPPVRDRIEAARQVQSRGFRVAFHWDPLILYPGWEQGYSEVIEQLSSKIDPCRIAWISLGSLRFPKPLKSLIRKRFPSTRIIYQEMVNGKDGKFRYFKPLRIKLYQKVVERLITHIGDKVPLYFCMESKEIWKKVLNKEPGSKEEVEYFLSLLPRFDAD
ncbi:MAG: hypothetical protein GF421_05430 [Candidatus Aminicenantes bacterium]|nr:hypothetical protein [Candidatus Aminicenantes bacterium]